MDPAITIKGLTAAGTSLPRSLQVAGRPSLPRWEFQALDYAISLRTVDHCLFGTSFTHERTTNLFTFSLSWAVPLTGSVIFWPTMLRGTPTGSTFSTRLAAPS